MLASQHLKDLSGGRELWKSSQFLSRWNEQNCTQCGAIGRLVYGGRILYRYYVLRDGCLLREAQQVFGMFCSVRCMRGHVRENPGDHHDYGGEV